MSVYKKRTVPGQYKSDQRQFSFLFCFVLFYPDCFLRAHFLTAETADTFFVVIGGRIFTTPAEIDRFVRHRTAVDADSTTDTFIFVNIWFLLKNIQGFCQTFPASMTDHLTIYVKIRISKLGNCIIQRYFALRRHKLDLLF